MPNRCVNHVEIYGPHADVKEAFEVMQVGDYAFIKHFKKAILESESLSFLVAEFSTRDEPWLGPVESFCMRYDDITYTHVWQNDGGSRGFRRAGPFVSSVDHSEGGIVWELETQVFPDAYPRILRIRGGQIDPEDARPRELEILALRRPLQKLREEATEDGEFRWY